MERIYPDGLATEKSGERSVPHQFDFMAVGKHDLGIGVNVAILQPRHPMVHPSRQFADLRVQRAAERDVHFLESPADAKERNAPRHAGIDQRQRHRVAIPIVGLMPGMRLDTKIGRMDIGARTGRIVTLGNVIKKAEEDKRTNYEHALAPLTTLILTEHGATDT